MTLLEVPTRIVDEIPHDAQTLSIFVIYHNPKDYPGKFVVREHASRPGQVLVCRKPVAIVGSIAEARASLHAGLFRMARHEKDDPAIFETWI